MWGRFLKENETSFGNTFIQLTKDQKGDYLRCWLQPYTVSKTFTYFSHQTFLFSRPPIPGFVLNVGGKFRKETRLKLLWLVLRFLLRGDDLFAQVLPDRPFYQKTIDRSEDSVWTGMSGKPCRETLKSILPNSTHNGVLFLWSRNRYYEQDEYKGNFNTPKS